MMLLYDSDDDIDMTNSMPVPKMPHVEQEYQSLSRSMMQEQKVRQTSTL